MNILIAETDPAEAARLKQRITGWGYRADTVSTSGAALSALQQHPYDLAFIDLRLETADGCSLIGELKRFSPEIPVVAMTSENSRELESSIRALGVIYYMIKPVDAVNTEAIIRFLSQKQTSQLLQEVCEWKTCP